MPSTPEAWAKFTAMLGDGATHDGLVLVEDDLGDLRVSVVTVGGPHPPDGRQHLRTPGELARASTPRS